MNTLGEALRDYIDLRRGLGFKMGDEARLLPRFVRFMDERQEAQITTRLALEWVQQAHSVQRAERARRLTFVRGFARFRSATDVHTEIPPVGLIPHRSDRARPYLYSDEEIRRLLDAALKLPTPRCSSQLRPWMFYCLFGLLSVTGLRISEALNLKLDDVDLSEGLLTIRGAKLNRSRLVPIHPSTCAVLAEYLKRRAQSFSQPISAYVFVSCRGTRLDLGRVHRTFYVLSRSVGLREPGASTGPRLHDFRHRMAVEVLTRWYQSGENVTRRLPILSTYLGHVCVSNTYWYLSASPELMAQAMQRLERRWEEQS
jgi:integrase